MKKIGAVAFICVLACFAVVVPLAGTFFLANTLTPAKAYAGPDSKCVFTSIEKETKLDFLEVKQLRIKSDDGKHSITMRSSLSGVGIYLQGEKGHGVTIASQGKGETYIGLHDGKSDGCPVAVALDKDGSPYVQVISEGKPVILSVKDLQKLAK